VTAPFGRSRSVRARFGAGATARNVVALERAETAAGEGNAKRTAATAARGAGTRRIARRSSQLGRSDTSPAPRRARGRGHERRWIGGGRLGVDDRQHADVVPERVGADRVAQPRVERASLLVRRDRERRDVVIEDLRDRLDDRRLLLLEPALGAHERLELLDGHGDPPACLRLFGEIPAGSIVMRRLPSP
jgi:hypothetical protein